MDRRPVIVITGATNGLGRLVALDLARQGAHGIQQALATHFVRPYLAFDHIAFDLSGGN